MLKPAGCLALESEQMLQNSSWATDSLGRVTHASHPGASPTFLPTTSCLLFYSHHSKRKQGRERLMSKKTNPAVCVCACVVKCVPTARPNRVAVDLDQQLPTPDT